MPAALPSALRARFQQYIEEGLSGRAAAARLKISAATGVRWQRKLRETGFAAVAGRLWCRPSGALAWCSFVWTSPCPRHCRVAGFDLPSRSSGTGLAGAQPMEIVLAVPGRDYGHPHIRPCPCLCLCVDWPRVRGRPLAMGRLCHRAGGPGYAVHHGHDLSQLEAYSGLGDGLDRFRSTSTG